MIPHALEHRGFPDRTVTKKAKSAAKDLIEVTEECAARFWNNHVLRDVPPEVSPNIELAPLIAFILIF